MTNYLHNGDIPADVVFGGDIAVDTETLGLKIYSRDRLCVVQLSDGNGNAHLVHLNKNDYDSAVNLKKVLSDKNKQYIFHYARFDIGVIKQYLGVDITNIYCTKIASKLVRTYTDHHSLKDLCKDFAGVDLSKQQQCSDWGADSLSDEQVAYAASDVLYLHTIREKLNEILVREGRADLAQNCFKFLPVRVELDIRGWTETDIFHH